MRYLFSLAFAVFVVAAAPAAAQVPDVPFPNSDCDAPAGDPAPGTHARVVGTPVLV